MPYYNTLNGDLNTNGKLLEGHRFWTLDGVKGVLVRDEGVTQISFSEELASTHTSEARI